MFFFFFFNVGEFLPPLDKGKSVLENIEKCGDACVLLHISICFSASCPVFQSSLNKHHFHQSQHDQPR